MKVLGLSCGRPMGNSEVLVREALIGAQEVSGADVEIIRLLNLNIKPCTGCENCIATRLKGVARYEYECVIENDDMPFLLDKLWESDGQIIGVPAYSFNPPGFFRMILDRLHSSGKRGVKPVPVGVIGVGGSDWVNMVLPLAGNWVQRIDGKLVDQMVVPFTARPTQVVLNEWAMARARKLGRNVGEALKLPLDKVQYVGEALRVSDDEVKFLAESMEMPVDWVREVVDEEEVCPICHSNLLQLRGKFVRCAMCDIKGTIEIKDDKIKVIFNEDEIQKRRHGPFESRRHQHIIRRSHQIYEKKKEEISEKRKKYETMPVTLPPRLKSK